MPINQKGAVWIGIAASFTGLCAQAPAKQTPSGVVGGIVDRGKPPAVKDQEIVEARLEWSPEGYKNFRHPYWWEDGSGKHVLLFPAMKSELTFRVRLTISFDGHPTIASCIKEPGVTPDWAKWMELYAMTLRFHPRTIDGEPKWSYAMVSIRATLRTVYGGDFSDEFLDISKPVVDSVHGSMPSPRE